MRPGLFEYSLELVAQQLSGFPPIAAAWPRDRSERECLRGTLFEQEDVTVFLRSVPFSREALPLYCDNLPSLDPGAFCAVYRRTVTTALHYDEDVREFRNDPVSLEQALRNIADTIPIL
jgi:hypothetical protein